jgi:hypothetical protein
MDDDVQEHTEIHPQQHTKQHTHDGPEINFSGKLFHKPDNPYAKHTADTSADQQPGPVVISLFFPCHRLHPLFLMGVL